LQHIGNNWPREVVVSRTEPAAADEKIHARQRVAYRGFKVAPIVADDRLEGDLDAEQIQLFGDEERVSVDLRRRQHLTADRDNRRPRDLLHVNQEGSRLTSPHTIMFP